MVDWTKKIIIIKPEEQLCKVGNETDRTGASFSKKNEFLVYGKKYIQEC